MGHASFRRGPGHHRARSSHCSRRRSWDTEPLRRRAWTFRCSFGADYVNFTSLDVGQEHQRAHRDLADELYREDSLELSRAGANRLAYAEPVGRPSAYALAVMMNFLTKTDAIPSSPTHSRG